MTARARSGVSPPERASIPSEASSARERPAGKPYSAGSTLAGSAANERVSSTSKPRGCAGLAMMIAAAVLGSRVLAPDIEPRSLLESIAAWRTLAVVGEKAARRFGKANDARRHRAGNLPMDANRLAR